ncbi:hypothetical protein BJX70DRAFT_360768 [Aspergillus crustosus]
MKEKPADLVSFMRLWDYKYGPLPRRGEPLHLCLICSFSFWFHDSAYLNLDIIPRSYIRTSSFFPFLNISIQRLKCATNSTKPQPASLNLKECLNFDPVNNHIRWCVLAEQRGMMCSWITPTSQGAATKRRMNCPRHRRRGVARRVQSRRRGSVLGWTFGGGWGIAAGA